MVGKCAHAGWTNVGRANCLADSISRDRLIGRHVRVTGGRTTLWPGGERETTRREREHDDVNWVFVFKISSPASEYHFLQVLGALLAGEDVRNFVRVT
jgi:hypothetical protein